MEMKTHRLKAENEAQTAYEMMKFGTDKFIKHMLRQGNVSVNKVVVFGILVDMDDNCWPCNGVGDGLPNWNSNMYQRQTWNSVNEKRVSANTREPFIKFIDNC